MHQVAVSWVAYFPSGSTDSLAADFISKVADAPAASAIWASSPTFQVLQPAPPACAPTTRSTWLAELTGARQRQAYGSATVAGVTTTANATAATSTVDALNPANTVLVAAAPSPATSGAGRASLALASAASSAALLLLLG